MLRKDLKGAAGSGYICGVVHRPLAGAELQHPRRAASLPCFDVIWGVCSPQVCRAISTTGGKRRCRRGKVRLWNLKMKELMPSHVQVDCERAGTCRRGQESCHCITGKPSRDLPDHRLQIKMQPQVCTAKPPQPACTARA